MSRRLATVAVILLLIAGSGLLYVRSTVKPQTTHAETVQPVKLHPPTTDKLFELVNAERAKAGVKPLALDTKLARSAQLKADDMAIHNYYSHSDRAGKHGYSYIRDLGAKCIYVSENLDIAKDSNEALTDWLQSAPHREAILNEQYDTTGFAVAYRGDHFGDYYVVEHFCDQ